jgi:hypothetical protein
MKGRHDELLIIVCTLAAFGIGTLICWGVLELVY